MTTQLKWESGADNPILTSGHYLIYRIQNSEDYLAMHDGQELWVGTLEECKKACENDTWDYGERYEAEANDVDDAYACPHCGERHCDKLAWFDDEEHVQCWTCGNVYRPEGSP